MKNAKYIVTVLMSISIIVSELFLSFTLSAEKITPTAGKNVSFTAEASEYNNLYESYAKLPKYEGWVKAKLTDKATATDYSSKDKSGAVVLNGNSTACVWKVNIPKDAVYGLKIEYCVMDDRLSDVRLAIEIDGKTPFKEVSPFSLRRLWKTDYADGEYPFDQDEDGNDLQPEQQDSKVWISDNISDRSGLYTEPYFFSLTAGQHLIKLKGEEGSVAVSELYFGNDSTVKYEDYIKKYSDKQVKNTRVNIQAEVTASTNNSAIIPSADRRDGSTVPNDPAFIKLNVIGASGWAAQGDTISWTADVKAAGLYKIALRARQNVNASMNAYRTILINGKLPFAEAEGIAFPYSTEWYMQTLGDGKKEFLFYLEPKDEISIVCTTGEMAPVLRNIQISMTELNALYLEVISYTSVDPDIYQDYQLEIKIPNLTEKIEKIVKKLKTSSAQIQELTGANGSQASTLDYAITILERFIEQPYLITEQLSSFKTSLETLSSLLQTINSCPLELDYLVLASNDEQITDADIGFFKSLAFVVKQFITSFGKGYDIAGRDNNKINVWVSTGRDQVQVMKNLIRNSFSVDTGIEVNLNIVDTGQTLIRATLAGKGPDAALMMGLNVPVNLAARKAIVDLNKYGLDELKKEFHPSAFVPFTYKNGLYALPETQTFNVLFYRTDVFKKYGIGKIKTWEDFYYAMETLQGHNMMVGIPEISSENAGISAGLHVFETFLIQNGGGFYTEDLSKTRFDEQVAYEAFEKWVNLYKDYGVDRQYDFYSRFRTGELPLAIASLNSYASLQQAAPELQGLWDIAPMPGIENADGTVNNAEPSDVTGCVMLKSAVARGVEKETVNFLKWWVSAETQTDYGISLERTLGVFGRYYTANLKAFENIAWSSDEHELIKDQWEKICNQPQLPGSYVLSRSLTSALRDVLDNNYRISRAFRIHNYDMNEELERKNKEFEN